MWLKRSPRCGHVSAAMIEVLLYQARQLSSEVAPSALKHDPPVRPLNTINSPSFNSYVGGDKHDYHYGVSYRSYELPIITATVY